jgi:putative component of membrane protein insertase Oxa1/YidC/SpoIIIJ protein YidD
MKLIYILFLIIITSQIAKTQPSDISQIAARQTIIPAYESTRIVTFGFSTSNSFIIKYNPFNLGLSTLMYSYQKWISPQISANCLFSPSCSSFSKDLIKHYGIIYGTICTADRLMRCDRISATAIKPIRICELDGKVHEEVTRYSFTP